MVQRARSGPQGLPVFVPEDRCSLFLSGVSGQRIGSSQTTTVQTPLLSIWVKPTTSGTVRHLISKNEVNASAFNEFPTVLRLNASNQVEFALSKSDDYVADLLLTSDKLVPANRWTHICAAYSSPTGHLLVNGTNYKTTTAAMTIGDNGRPYTLGNSAADNSGGGTDTVLYTGYMFDPRLYNWNGDAFISNAMRLMRGEDLRGGLVVEWMPRDVPVRKRSGFYGT